MNQGHKRFNEFEEVWMGDAYERSARNQNKLQPNFDNTTSREHSV